MIYFSYLKLYWPYDFDLEFCFHVSNFFAIPCDFSFFQAYLTFSFISNIMRKHLHWFRYVTPSIISVKYFSRQPGLKISTWHYYWNNLNFPTFFVTVYVFFFSWKKLYLRRLFPDVKKYQLLTSILWNFHFHSCL